MPIYLVLLFCLCLFLFLHYLFSLLCYCYFFFFFKQKTAYEMRISDWSSDVCSSDLIKPVAPKDEFETSDAYRARLAAAGGSGPLIISKKIEGAEYLDRKSVV